MKFHLENLKSLLQKYNDWKMIVCPIQECGAVMHPKDMQWRETKELYDKFEVKVSEALYQEDQQQQ